MASLSCANKQATKFKEAPHLLTRELFSKVTNIALTQVSNLFFKDATQEKQQIFFDKLSNLPKFWICSAMPSVKTLSR